MGSSGSITKKPIEQGSTGKVPTPPRAKRTPGAASRSTVLKAAREIIKTPKPAAPPIRKVPRPSDVGIPELSGEQLWYSLHMTVNEAVKYQMSIGAKVSPQEVHALHDFIDSTYSRKNEDESNSAITVGDRVKSSRTRKLAAYMQCRTALDDSRLFSANSVLLVNSSRKKTRLIVDEC